MNEDFLSEYQGKIHLGDCVPWLKEIPDCSIDLIIADPPYAIGFDGGKGWDSLWKDEDEYLQWCKVWSEECARVLKPKGMLVVWGTLKTDVFLRYKLEVLNKIDGIFPQDEIIWSYNWGGRAKRNFARKHEYAWCYSKGKEFVFNGDDVRIPRKVSKNIRTGLPYEKGTIPTLVWEKNNHTGSKDAVNWHPTTKNPEILGRIIKAYSPVGGVILDPFMGSGSTAIASIRAERLFLGAEIDEEYYDKASKRILQELERN